MNGVPGWQQAVRDALISFMAATAQAQSEATKEARRAGIELAKAEGESYLGRKPTYTRATLQAVYDHLGQGTGIAEIAKDTGLSRQAIYRIKGDRAGAEAALQPRGCEPPTKASRVIGRPSDRQTPQ